MKKNQEFEKIIEIIDLAIRANVTELEIEEGGRVLRFKKAEYRKEEVKEKEEVEEKKEEPSTNEKKIVKILSPLTGTFYSAPSPQAPPYVEVGDVVKEGDVLGLIEAMKLFNEVKSHVDGEVDKIFVESGESVEKGQVLIHIKLL